MNAPAIAVNGEAVASTVRRLTVTDFRSYASATLEAGAGPIVLSGPNGAGKTNLLEAISLLSPGAGLRQARLTEITRRGAMRWAVTAEVAGPAGAVAVGSGLTGAPGEEKRTARLDGETVGPMKLAGVAPVSWLTPQMDRLFQDGASVRRRFMDRLILGFDPGHGMRANRYEQAMRERLRLLKDGRRDAAWLAALEAQMVAHGVGLAAARRDWASRTAAALAAGAGPFPAATIALEGLLEQALDQGAAAEAEDRFAAELADGRERDAQAGRTLVGPHRSDLKVWHLARDMPAPLCSTGEQKALLIALVLADTRIQAAARGRTPILLLDEVAAHLDESRREALFGELRALGAQVWLTGAEPGLFEALGDEARRYEISEDGAAPTR